MTSIKFTKEDARDGLSDKEKEAIIEAWDEYTYDEPVTMNENNHGFKHHKNMILSYLDTALFAAKMTLCDKFGSIDVDNEYDYELVVTDIVRNLKRTNFYRA